MQTIGDFQRVRRQVLPVGVDGDHAERIGIVLDNVSERRLQGGALAPVGGVGEHGDALAFGQPFEDGGILTAVVDDEQRQAPAERVGEPKQRLARIVGRHDGDDVRAGHGIRTPA